MYCRNCGQQIDDKAKRCPYCGAIVESIRTKDRPIPGFVMLGLLLGIVIPIVGLILFLVYRKDYPRRAKSLGRGTLIGFILAITFVISFVPMLYPRLIQFIRHR